MVFVVVEEAMMMVMVEVLEVEIVEAMLGGVERRRRRRKRLEAMSWKEVLEWEHEAGSVLGN